MAYFDGMMARGDGVVNEERCGRYSGFYRYITRQTQVVVEFVRAGLFVLESDLTAEGPDSSRAEKGARVAGAAGQFTRSGTMAERRRWHSAVLLQDGRVLVVGGRRDSGLHFDRGKVDSAEIWDPATEDWMLTGTMSNVRVRPALALLPDGRVLVAGGEGIFNFAIRSVEIWDPATGEWAKGPNLKVPHDNPRWVTLQDDRLILIGGLSDTYGPLGSVEVYDATSDAWTKVAPMAVRRSRHTATLLQDGRVVLIVGGTNKDGIMAETEVYSP